MRVVLLCLLLASSCGGEKKGAAAGDCKAACSHLIDLAGAALDETGKSLPADVLARLKEQADSTHDSDLATCIDKCKAGHLDTACVKQAKSYDGTETCIKRPDEPAGKQPDDSNAWKEGGSWIGEPLARRDDETGGIRFSIELPDGLRRQVEGDTIVYVVENGNPFANPTFELRALHQPFPASAAEGKTMVSPTGDVTLRSQLAPDGGPYVVIVHNPERTFVTGYALHKAGDGALLCKGTQSKSGGLADLEKIGAWFALVCESIRIAPPP